MTLLNNQQKQLLFDYSIGLTSEEEAAEASRLIASSKEASEAYSKLKAALAPLEALNPHPCPDDLVEGTIWRLNNVALSSQLRLGQLLAAEQARSPAVKARLCRNLCQVAAAAAVILIVAAIGFAPISYARQKYWQCRCRTQLARFFQGFTDYISDHDGQMPAVATTAGAPWWKVGYPGTENHSNTRNMWLLVKEGYVKPADFVCPGSRQKAILMDRGKLTNYHDFPDRTHITYSFRIRCNKSKEGRSAYRQVIMADLSPLFESLPDDFTKPFTLQLNEKLLLLNSSNHNRRGQNVLFCNGSIKFVKERHTDISYDDIFTLREMYQGCEIKGDEVPSCESDAFLAP